MLADQPFLKTLTRELAYFPVYNFNISQPNVIKLRYKILSLAKTHGPFPSASPAVAI